MSSARQQIGAASAEASRQLYESDEHEWIARQIAALRSGNFHDLDAEHLTEFLEDSMSRDRRELGSRFTRLLQHLLKIRMQPEMMTRSWLLTTVHQQNEIRRIFRDTPSIKHHSAGLFTEAYEDAIREAAAETGIPAQQFPPTSPWTIEEALSFAAPELPQASGSRRTARRRS